MIETYKYFKDTLRVKAESSCPSVLPNRSMRISINVKRISAQQIALIRPSKPRQCKYVNHG